MVRDAEVVDTTYREDRISATVEVEVTDLPIGGGEKIAKSRARKAARKLIPFRNQKVGHIERIDGAGLSGAKYRVLVKHQNPQSEFGTRDVKPKEQQLWETSRSKLMDPYGPDILNVTELGSNMGLHEKGVREIVKVWKKEDLVETYRGLNHIALTDKGRKTPKLPPA